MTQDRRPDVVLLSHGRTLSNLFCKMMSKQDAFNHAEYHFHEAYMHIRKTMKDKPLAEYPESVREEYYDMLRAGYKQFFKDLNEAHDQGRPVFFKDHVMQTCEPAGVNQRCWGGQPAPTLHLCGDEKNTNPTMLPDSFFLGAVPVFIIRHPAMQNESWYRADLRVGPVDITTPIRKMSGDISNCRKLLEWYEANVPADVAVDAPKRPGPFKPIVIDADDLLDNPAAIEELCRRCNFDPAKVAYEWEATGIQPDLDERTVSYLQDIWKSTGVDKSKSSKGVTIEGKYQKWKEEFGVEAADFLKQKAEAVMDDYLYMKARKI